MTLNEFRRLIGDAGVAREYSDKELLEMPLAVVLERFMDELTDCVRFEAYMDVY